MLSRAKSNMAPDDGNVAYALNLVGIGANIAATRAV